MWGLLNTFAKKFKGKTDTTFTSWEDYHKTLKKMEQEQFKKRVKRDNQKRLK